MSLPTSLFLIVLFVLLLGWLVFEHWLFLAMIGGMVLAWAAGHLLAYLDGRRVERRKQALVEALRAESEEELKGRLVGSPYFEATGTEGRTLRSTPAVQGFLEAVEEERYGDLLEGLGSTFTTFVQAERSIGRTGRPLLIDYDVEIGMVVKELFRRQVDADQS